MSFKDRQDLSHIKVGDHIANSHRNRSWNAKEPKVDYELHKVLRVTDTQIVTEGPHKEMRWNRSDGTLRGEYFVNAIEATPELIAKRNEQVIARNRYTEARRRCSDIEAGLGRRLFDVETMEAIAHAFDAAQGTGTRVVRKGYVCTGCEFVYCDAPTSKCDCSTGPTDSDEYIPATITYAKP